jgi:hypothetical protein
MNDNQLAISLSCLLAILPSRYLSTGSPLHTWSCSSIHSCSHSLLSLEVGQLVVVRGRHVGVEVGEHASMSSRHFDEGHGVGVGLVGEHLVGGGCLLR